MHILDQPRTVLTDGHSPAMLMHPAPSWSEAELLLITIEDELRSLDRTPGASRSVQELEQVVADIREALGRVSG